MALGRTRTGESRRLTLARDAVVNVAAMPRHGSPQIQIGYAALAVFLALRAWYRQVKPPSLRVLEPGPSSSVLSSSPLSSSASMLLPPLF